MIERRVHDGPVAEQTKLSTRRHLPAGIGWRDVVDHARGRDRKNALHLHGIELKGTGTAGLIKSMHGEGTSSAAAESKVRAREQSPQGFVGRHRPLDTSGREAADEIAVDRQMPARLLPEQNKRTRH